MGLHNKIGNYCKVMLSNELGTISSTLSVIPLKTLMHSFIKVTKLLHPQELKRTFKEAKDLSLGDLWSTGFTLIKIMIKIYIYIYILHGWWEESINLYIVYPKAIDQ